MLLLILILNIYFLVTDGRVGLTSALIGSKLYIMGGADDKYVYASLLYYDFTVLFDNIGHHATPIPVYSIWGTASIGGPNRTKIFLIGGKMEDKSSDSLSNTLVYSFDTINDNWTAPEISGNQPLRRREASSTFNPDNGWIYIFGGATVKSTNFNSTKFFNDFIILDSIGLSWINFNSSIDAPSRRASHTATLISNGIIVFIGGYELVDDKTIQDVDINQILMYDTKLGKWDYQFAVGDNVDPRNGHTSVLAPDGNIITYGGCRIDDLRSKPDLVVLKVTTIPFQWFAPSIPTENAPPPLTCHVAAIIENCMVISYGNITSDFSEPIGGNSEIYLFDTNSYKWIKEYMPHSGLFFF
ncbi:galactose oxidase [Gigaspora margarita]|uniref:Galactose oxidase n=1 Tax=Gigaspora margarita TaxID=4874 RepID=A0A8H4A0C6_GIGMA|nr:galactose oxidase [Gigaspora margarita]